MQSDEFASNAFATDAFATASVPFLPLANMVQLPPHKLARFPHFSQHLCTVPTCPALRCVLQNSRSRLPWSPYPAARKQPSDLQRLLRKSTKPGPLRKQTCRSAAHSSNVQNRMRQHCLIAAKLTCVVHKHWGARLKAGRRKLSCRIQQIEHTSCATALGLRPMNMYAKTGYCPVVCV